MVIDMTTRRGFLTGMLAAGIVPVASWADLGNPAFLSAGRESGNRHVMCGLTSKGNLLFKISLPARGHEAAAHPVQAEAVAFARRPGNFAMVIDCTNGKVKQILDAPPEYHFFGHETFSADGSLMFTTENDYEAAAGRIGIWDTRNGYHRVGEIGSGGIGPHDIKYISEQEILVVANGGIETHPESGRAKLNVPMMRPNLSYVSIDGKIIDQIEPAHSEHMNSIRHLAIRNDGLVAFACQWQGRVETAPALLGTHRLGDQKPVMLHSNDEHPQLLAYLGSVSFNSDGKLLANTAPRGNIAQIFDSADKTLVSSFVLQDICGVTAIDEGFMFTTGKGLARYWTGEGFTDVKHDIEWDNHLVNLNS